MFSFKSWIICILFVFTLNNFEAQNRYATWLRGTFTISLNKQFKLDHEFQYRRQNGSTNYNLFDKDLMSSYRSWVSFQTKEIVKFSLSPFAYFYHYNLSEDKHTVEYRYTIACEIQKLVKAKQRIVNRFALEYRMYQNTSNSLFRFRDRIGYRYELSDKMYITFSDELFVSLSKIPAEFFDQNRLGLNVGYMLSSHLKLDVGYNFVHRKKASNLTLAYENNLLIYLNYRIGKEH